MDVYGCQIVSRLATDSREGFASTVCRGSEQRGPFATIGEAIECAKGWSADLSALPVLESISKTETASDSLAVQIPLPTINPPVADGDSLAPTQLTNEEIVQ